MRFSVFCFANKFGCCRRLLSHLFLFFAFIYTHYVHWTLYTLLVGMDINAICHCTASTYCCQQAHTFKRIELLLRARPDREIHLARKIHTDISTFDVLRRPTAVILFNFVWIVAAEKWDERKGKYFRFAFYVLYQFVLLVFFFFFLFEVFLSEVARNGEYVNGSMRACGQVICQLLSTHNTQT